jgi:hypothetical protein
MNLDDERAKLHTAGKHIGEAVAIYRELHEAHYESGRYSRSTVLDGTNALLHMAQRNAWNGFYDWPDTPRPEPDWMI